MKFDSKEIFGAEIQYFRLDPDYWEKIIIAFKESGLRTVTSYVPWELHAVSEPDKKNPAGKLDFEGKTNPRLNLLRFLDLIEKHNLNMNFRCGPFCCNEMDYGGHPGWLVLGDPDMMVWDYQNRTTQGYWVGKKEGSQPSYLHPRYLQLCNAWITEVDKIILPRLKSKGGFITMINIDNEISYIVKDAFLDSDYNPVNVQKGGLYHQFLSDKYKKAENLPYTQKVKNIEDINPPRYVPEHLDENFAYYADWVEFKTWIMCRFICEIRKMHENNGVKDVIFMTNFNPHLPEGVPTRMPEFEKALGENGTAGYDFYRGVFMSYSGYHSMARVLKLMNATLKYTWSPEFMSGTWMKNLGSTRVSDDHMRFMARCALSQGCKSMCWFMFHDRDCWGDAPVSSHGHKRPSFQILSETPKILFDKIKNWAKLVPQMDTVVVYDPVHHIHTSIGDPSPCNDNDSYVGKPMINGIEAGKASSEYYGLFRLIEEAGYQAGVVDIVHSPDKLLKYRVAFMPGSPVCSSRAVRTFDTFVSSGGILVISGTLPVLDETGKKINFFNKAIKGESKIGKGKIIFIPNWIAQEKPEEENLNNIALIQNLLRKFYGDPIVCSEPIMAVKWIDWKQGGGKQEYIQPRNLSSAILHSSEDEKVLFILNHYIDAVRLRIRLPKLKAKKLINLSTDEIIYAEKNCFEIDIDRKSAEIYKVE